MNKIKINSNPYMKEINYSQYNHQTNDWEDVKYRNPDSKLRDVESSKTFLPFKIHEILGIIASEYGTKDEKVQVVFEGTQEEYAEVKTTCESPEFVDRLELIKSSNYLENARFIFEDTKDVFEDVEPVIKRIVRDDVETISNLEKVSDALKDIIPICVFGNYSAGKSTFINALVGYEYLPSGGDPVTAKIYKISRSQQQDSASIDFWLDNEPYKLTFEGSEFRVRSGNVSSMLMNEIIAAIEACDETDLVSKISNTLEILNSYERKNRSETHLGSVIEIKAHFSKEGILGQTLNNFVIFDTPGSNSASNLDHSLVLGEALKGFSNGIPVWVTTYDSIDSDDNAALCKRISEIEALDNRFTMIVVNRADMADLPEGGFNKEDIQNILEYNSVDKMYSGGIYFVSSIMGLGSKNEDNLRDKFYRKTFRTLKDLYCDPEDEDYSTLYIYNIMPEQIKERAVAYSKDCSDLVYANSGLLSVEMEMESFATKYAAYNKCQMVKMFLEQVVKETSKRIERRTSDLKRTREARQNELDETKASLITIIENEETEKEKEFDKSSKDFTKSYVDANFDYKLSVDKLEGIDSENRQKNQDINNLQKQEEVLADAKTRMWEHFKTSGKSLFTGSFIESVKVVKDDYKEVKEMKQQKEEAEKESDRNASDETIKAVIEQYKYNIVEANEKLSKELREFWHDRTQELKSTLIAIVTDSDALTDGQRRALSEIIMDYKDIELNDDAENIFIKKKFLRGNVLGLKLNDDERLNIKRLTSIYNDRIEESVQQMSTRMNDNYYTSYKPWVQNLHATIENNIVDYNPKLRSMSDMIGEETEKITELENDQDTIERSLAAIEEMMAWK